jgi:hypothetical protein
MRQVELDYWIAALDRYERWGDDANADKAREKIAELEKVNEEQGHD